MIMFCRILKMKTSWTMWMEIFTWLISEWATNKMNQGLELVVINCFRVLKNHLLDFTRN